MFHGEGFWPLLYQAQTSGGHGLPLGESSAPLFVKYLV